MIETLIERNPGDVQKKVSLDRTLRGNYVDSPNFEQMFKLYWFGKNQHFGTKADVIDLGSFLEFLGKEFLLDERLTGTIMQNPVLRNLTNFQGYLTCFWDKPSELHHRDIMRYCFGELNNSIEQYRIDVAKRREDLSHTPWVHHFGEMNRELGVLHDRVETTQLQLMLALEELSESKVASSSVELGPVARKIVEVSQGYLIYSEDPQNEKDLRKSRIYRIKLESKITKDQRTLNILPSSEAILKNVQNFVDSLVGVELKTNRIVLPDSHLIPLRSIQAHSYDPSPGSPRNVDLRVQYGSPGSGLIDC